MNLYQIMGIQASEDAAFYIIFTCTWNIAPKH